MTFDRRLEISGACFSQDRSRFSDSVVSWPGTWLLRVVISPAFCPSHAFLTVLVPRPRYSESCIWCIVLPWTRRLEFRLVNLVIEVHIVILDTPIIEKFWSLAQALPWDKHRLRFCVNFLQLVCARSDIFIRLRELRKGSHPIGLGLTRRPICDKLALRCNVASNVVSSRSQL